jgi:prepilin-type N-terminal cleavage/methylation domain-containing protein/prepilin-type processing-associated H-X9-DG protein
MLRRGLTLTEFLVAISIIGLLMALLLPAVQGARERTRRTQCAANLAQMGKALQGYESARRTLPGATPRNVASGTPWYSPHTQLLSYVERKDLAQRVDLLQPYAPILETSTNYLDAAMLDGGSAGVASQFIGLFRCPSDTWRPGDTPGNNYRFSLGPGPYEHAGGGAFSITQPHSLGEIADGLSNTVAASEKLVGTGVKMGFSTRQDFWYSGATLLGPAPDLDEMVELCKSLSGTPASFAVFAGSTWYFAGYENTWYNHAVTPNAPCPDCSANSKTVSSTNGGVFRATSEHPGGVNCLFVDGGVRFVNDEVNLQVWRALGTRAGGEITHFAASQ